MEFGINQKFMILLNFSVLVVAIITFSFYHKHEIYLNTCYKIDSQMDLKKKDGENFSVLITKGSDTVKGVMSRKEIKSYPSIPCPN
jgi:hypothetical protein